MNVTSVAISSQIRMVLSSLRKARKMDQVLPPGDCIWSSELWEDAMNSELLPVLPTFSKGRDC